MRKITKPGDLSGLKQVVQDWIIAENPWLEDGDLDGNSGYLLVLEDGDDLSNLSIGIETLKDLAHHDGWEWAAHDEALGYWLACSILGDDFGVVFVIPDKLLEPWESLRSGLSEVMSTTLPCCGDR